MKYQLSEKLTETLFNIYFHRMFKLGEVTFFAPSIQKEADLGYDGRLVGNKSNWELLLQFKQPAYLRRKNFFRFPVDTDQLEALQKAIKTSHGIRDYVYYAAPVFNDASEIDGLQKITHDECCFLNHYMLIKASSLPSNTKYIFFERVDTSKPSHCACHTPINPSYKTQKDTNPSQNEGSIPIARDDWMLVCPSVQMFKERKIGAQIVPPQNGRLQHFRTDDSVFSRGADPSRTTLTDLIGASLKDKHGSLLGVRLNSFENP